MATDRVGLSFSVTVLVDGCAATGNAAVAMSDAVSDAGGLICTRNASGPPGGVDNAMGGGSFGVRKRVTVLLDSKSEWWHVCVATGNAAAAVSDTVSGAGGLIWGRKAWAGRAVWTTR